jgi:hypothetical protein
MRSLTIQTRGEADLPFGHYTVECYAPSYRRTFRFIYVDSETPEFTCGLARREPGDQVSFGTWTVKGKIAPRPSASSVLLRLVGIFLDVSKEVEISPSGDFSVSVPLQGGYSLMVLAKGSIVLQKRIDIDITTPRRLDLGILDHP